jgi:xylulokinase
VPATPRWTPPTGGATWSHSAATWFRGGASYGDALLAAIGTGLVDPETDWTTTARTVTPDGSNPEVYEQLYCSLYPATRDHLPLLAQLQESTAPADQPVP